MFDQQSRIKATLILRDWLFQYLKDPSTLITFYHLNINFRKWFEHSPREKGETWEVQLWGKMCRHLDSSRAVSVSHKTSRSQKVPVDSGELCDHEMAERSQGWFSVFSLKVVHQLIMKWGEFTTFSDSLFIMTFIFFVLVVFTESCELVILTITN